MMFTQWLSGWCTAGGLTPEPTLWPEVRAIFTVSFQCTSYSSVSGCGSQCGNKVLGLGGFNNNNVFFRSSGGWDSEIKVMAGSFPSEASLCS